jgi:hypothetical protein
MTVPKRLFGFGKTCEQLFADDVLDPHQLGVLTIAIVDHALDNFLIEDSAVMVGLHLGFHVAVIKMEAVQVRIQCVYRRA